MEQGISKANNFCGLLSNDLCKGLCRHSSPLGDCLLFIYVPWEPRGPRVFQICWKLNRRGCWHRELNCNQSGKGGWDSLFFPPGSLLGRLMLPAAPAIVILALRQARTYSKHFEHCLRERERGICMPHRPFQEMKNSWTLQIVNKDSWLAIQEWLQPPLKRKIGRWRAKAWPYWFVSSLMLHFISFWLCSREYQNSKFYKAKPSFRKSNEMQKRGGFSPCLSLLGLTK